MQRISAPTTVLIFLAIAMWFTAGAKPAASADCVGKTYGYPGCPTRPASSSGSSASSSRHCGNSILDEGEQCDNGRFNGKTGCSDDCKILYCGDGVVTMDIREECDPPREEYYVLDKNGNLTTEIRFAAPPACGWYCKPPECTATACTGGCQLKFIGECSKSSSQASSSASQSSAGQSSAGQSSAESGSGKGISVSSGSAAPVASMSSSSFSSTSSFFSISSTRAVVCGDGIRQAKEECDDGNRNNADGCSNACRLARCGDGIVQKREECDKGKENSNTQPDACRVSCRKPICGDKVVDRGEMCDPPGRRPDLTAANALCSRDCKFAPIPAAAVSAVSANKGQNKSQKNNASDGGDNASSGIEDNVITAAIGTTAVVIAGLFVFLLRKAVSIFRFRNSK